jgi:GH25 family lysozyme M1 (1,4-beta-N-acetylmuramidase)
VAGTGIDFAMVRVGYRDSSTGEIKADTNAKYNMQEAEKNGIKIGAYFFSTAVSAAEAVEEANWVANYISKYPITYPVGFNCEGFDNASSRQYNLTKDERSAVALAFLDQIYSAGYTPIFYASRGELSGDAKWNTSQIQQKYKIWMAWYDQDVSNLAGGPAYEGQCAMWQYSSKGTVAGIGKSVDVDVAYFGYNGTETAKDTSERENATADVEALMKFSAVEENVTAKNNTNLRDKPSQGSESTVKATLQNGQVALRTGISDSGWSRVVYEGNTYYAVSSFLTTDLSAPKQEEPKVVEDNSGFKTKFTDCNEVVTAKDVVNLRSKPSVTDEDSAVVASLSSGDTAVRTGINQEYGWSRVEYNGQTLYCVSSYLKVVE